MKIWLHDTMKCNISYVIISFFAIVPIVLLFKITIIIALRHVCCHNVYHDELNCTNIIVSSTQNCNNYESRLK